MESECQRLTGSTITWHRTRPREAPSWGFRGGECGEGSSYETRPDPEEEREVTRFLPQRDETA